MLFAVIGIIYLCVEISHGYRNKTAVFFLLCAIGGFVEIIVPTSRIGLWFWFAEIVGLSSLALFTPALIYNGIHKKPKIKDAPKESEGTKHCGFNFYLIIGSLAPVIFIWALPWLGNYPNYFNKTKSFAVNLCNNKTVLKSISNYIGNA